MDWVADVGKARDGDVEARERLGEHVTPFVHSVLLAQVPHHVAHRLVPRVLEDLFASLKDVQDAAAGAHAMGIARRHAETAARAGTDEVPSANAQVHEGRQTLRRLRSLPVPTRERLLLRLVAGVPGPEQAEFSGASPETVRQELESGAQELARALGQAAAFSDDSYLWEAMGAPSAFLARLEMQLTALRFSPGASDNSVVADSDSASTFTSLSKVEEKKKGPWDADDVTESQGRPRAEREPPMTEPAVPATANPFKAAAATIAASDLPAAASSVAHDAQAPQAAIPSGSQSRGPIAPIPQGSQARGSPSKNPIAPIPQGSQSKNPIAPIPQGSQARGSKAALVPSAAVPTTVPMDGAVANAATRINPVHPAAAAEDTAPRGTPLGAPAAIANMHTEMRLDAVVPRARPVLFSSKGAAPFVMAAALGVVGLVGGWTAVTSSERAAKSAWTMTDVVVAAEDLNEGAIITQENLAIRSVPDSFITTMVVRPSQLGLVLEQRLAVPVQTGDPIIYNQLAAVRVSERLSTRIVPRARAVSITVDTVTAVGRWVRPGDHVDVLSAFEDPRRGRTAVTFLQNVPVVAAGPLTNFIPEKSVNERKRAYQNVTFLLTPEEVEAVTLATQVGKVTLTLRTEEDYAVKDRDFHTELKTLLTGERIKLLEAQRFHTIQMIRSAPKEPKEPKDKDSKKPR